MLNMVSKSSLSESGKLPKVSSGVSRNLTELEKRISKFISSTERAPAQKEEVKVKVEKTSEEEEKVEEKNDPTFKRLKLEQLQGDIERYLQQSNEEDQVKVHEIKFDEFGIMDDGLEESTADQLKNLGKDNEEGATAIDEDLFEDEDLEELEEDMQNLDVWNDDTKNFFIHSRCG